MDTQKLEKQLQDIITDYANKIWDNHKELNYNADRAVEFEEAIWDWIKQNFIPLELPVKPANGGHPSILLGIALEYATNPNKESFEYSRETIKKIIDETLEINNMVLELKSRLSV
jgi:hypothetical protein